jgi:hypothetical protein
VELWSELYSSREFEGFEYVIYECVGHSIGKWEVRSESF